MLRLIGVRDGDRGAVAMIVAMLFGFGVMLGLAALTVDVGNINADRRQLQNGADAVALAVAQQCAKTGTCDPLDTTLGDLANANAADGATSIRRVDGKLPLLAPVTTPPTPPYPAICGHATGLLECQSQTTWTQSMLNLQECPAPPPEDVNYVRVYTETKNSAGGNILPYYFGAALTGISGANQQACATVVWGPPSGAAAPITLSYCEWAAATGYEPPLTPGGAPVNPGGIYYPDGSPGYGVGQTPWPTPALQLPSPPVAGHEIIIQLQGSHPTTCQSWNGHDVPGGFGYLSTTTGCTSVAQVNGWIQVDTGNTLPAGCPSLLPYFNTVIYLPVFDCTRQSGSAPSSPPIANDPNCTEGAGSNTWYHVEGYAKFFLSGYKTGGGPSDEAGRTNYGTEPPLPCTGNDRCLSGWFLQGLVDAPPAPPPPDAGGPPLGAYSIKLAG